MRKLMVIACGFMMISTLGIAQKVDTTREISIVEMKAIYKKYKPLYVIDGVVYKGNIEKIDTSTISNVVFMENPVATYIYGAEAINGAIIITTKTERAHIDSLDRRRKATLDEVKALIVIDGIIYKGPITKINPNNIENVSVLKGKRAIDLYGEAAKNGVLLIEMKHRLNIDSTKTDTAKREIKE